jgi:hypothetical protein
MLVSVGRLRPPHHPALERQEKPMVRTLAAASATALVVLALGTLSAAGATVATCPGSFEGTVYHGPHAGFALTGQMLVSLDDSGELTGTLTRDDGTTVPVSGFVAGTSIHLEFALAEGAVSGAGDLVGNDFATCTGTATGSLHGPDPADTGNWGIVWGS